MPIKIMTIVVQFRQTYKSRTTLQFEKNNRLVLISWSVNMYTLINLFCFYPIAFKGRRDLVLFTTKRILFVDKQGWSGKKMAYTTFPYSSIKIFNVATAGTMDRDCEFGFYTEVWFDPPKCNGCENGCGMLYYYIFAT